MIVKNRNRKRDSWAIFVSHISLLGAWGQVPSTSVVLLVILLLKKKKKNYLVGFGFMETWFVIRPIWLPLVPHSHRPIEIWESFLNSFPSIWSHTFWGCGVPHGKIVSSALEPIHYLLKQCLIMIDFEESISIDQWLWSHRENIFVLLYTRYISYLGNIYSRRGIV